MARARATMNATASFMPTGSTTISGCPRAKPGKPSQQTCPTTSTPEKSSVTKTGNCPGNSDPVQNLVASGTGEAAAMSIAGHADPSVFKRYNVRRDAVQAEAAERRQVVAWWHG